MYNYTSYLNFNNNRISPDGNILMVDDYLNNLNITNFIILYNIKLTLQFDIRYDTKFINELTSFFTAPLSNFELMIKNKKAYKDYHVLREFILIEENVKYNNILYNHNNNIINYFKDLKNLEAVSCRRRRFEDLLNFNLVNDFYKFKDLYIFEGYDEELIFFINNSNFENEIKNKMINKIKIYNI